MLTPLEFYTVMAVLGFVLCWMAWRDLNRK